MINKKIKCYIISNALEVTAQNIDEFRKNGYKQAVCSIKISGDTQAPSKNDNENKDSTPFFTVKSPESTDTLVKILKHTDTPYILWFKKASAMKLAEKSLQTMVETAERTNAAIVFANHYDVKNGVREEHPLIDYTEGSVTDDFDFGSLLLISVKSLEEYLKAHTASRYQYAGFYDFRLFAGKKHPIVRIDEYLYDEIETDLRLSGQKQFDYVDPRNRRRQIEMERAFTEYLKEINAFIPPYEAKRVDFTKEAFECEASVIIPVRNRVKTVKDAVESALSQKTKFPFNVIVVDNHSTDGTTDVLKQLSSNKQLVHIIPKRTDLGIGGCWELAVKNKKCGRFAVQLDSDDLYADENTLQTIVNKFYRTHAAMVIGSYRMVDFKLNTLPPGIIDHKEWTSENGRNNALRINGLGAPRAFYTPILRKTGVPNTSYGEDYALGLVFSREYYIARIFDVVYLCRRWEGNSDAALSQVKTNKNNAYKNSLRAEEINKRRKLNILRQHHVKQNETINFFNKQLKCWKEVDTRFEQLKNVQTKNLSIGNVSLTAQFNPARIVSTGAKVDKSSISKRPCFLCDNNRPKEQINLPVEERYQVLINPFPILPNHITVTSRFHEPQNIGGRYYTLVNIAKSLSDFVVFYNGPTSGASAPDHMHFQAGARGVMPLEKDWNKYSLDSKALYIPDNATEGEGIYEITSYACPAIAIVANTGKRSVDLFNKLYSVLNGKTDGVEYPMNVISWNENEKLVTVIFLRKKLRPECYSAQGDEQFIISPGSVDMCGLLITPRKEDFERLTPEKAVSILKEVTISKEDIEKIGRELYAKESL